MAMPGRLQNIQEIILMMKNMQESINLDFGAVKSKLRRGSLEKNANLAGQQYKFNNCFFFRKG